MLTHFPPTNVSIKPCGTHPTLSKPPSLKDYVLVKPRLMASMLDTTVFRGADIDSDHQLVITSIREKLQKKYKEKRGKLFVVKLLHNESTKADFINSVTKGFENRKMERSVEESYEVKKYG